MKIVNSGKKLTKQHKGKISNSMLKKKKSSTHRQNIRKAVTKEHASLTDEQKSLRYDNWILAASKNRRNRNTRPALIFAKLLEDKNIKCEIEFKIGKHFVDFYLPDFNMVVEINGCYWHQCEKCNQNSGHNGMTAEEIRNKEALRLEYIKSKGYKVKVIWEHDLVN